MHFSMSTNWYASCTHRNYMHGFTVIWRSFQQNREWITIQVLVEGRWGSKEHSPTCWLRMTSQGQDYVKQNTFHDVGPASYQDVRSNLAQHHNCIWPRSDSHLLRANWLGQRSAHCLMFIIFLIVHIWLSLFHWLVCTGNKPWERRPCQKIVESFLYFFIRA